MQISIRIKDDKVFVGMRKFGAAIPDITKRALQRTMQSAVRIAKVYPVQPGHSRYVRTFVYRGSFSIRPEHSGNVYKYVLESDAVSPRGRHYTKYVGGDSNGIRPTWNTKHWPLIKDIVENEARVLIGELPGELKTAAESFGL